MKLLATKLILLFNVSIWWNCHGLHVLRCSVMHKHCSQCNTFNMLLIVVSKIVWKWLRSIWNIFSILLSSKYFVRYLNENTNLNKMMLYQWKFYWITHWKLGQGHIKISICIQPLTTHINNLKREKNFLKSTHA